MLRRAVLCHGSVWHRIASEVLPAQVTSGCFSRDGAYLVGAGSDGARPGCILSATAAVPLPRLQLLVRPATCLPPTRLDRGAREMHISASPGVARIWHARTGLVVRKLEPSGVSLSSFGDHAAQSAKQAF